MEIKTSKKQKFIFCLFIGLLFAGIIGGITASASAYDNVSIEIVEHITVATWQNNFIRSFSFAILKFIATLIDYLEAGIDIILSFDMQSMFEAVTGSTNTYPIAWAVLSISMILSGIVLLAMPDKITIKENVRNIMVCTLFVIALPTLITTLGNLKSSGLNDIDNINATNDYSLGDQLLSENIIRVKASVQNNALQYYSELPTGSVSSEAYRTPKSVYQININATRGTEDPVLREKVVSINEPLNYELQYETPLNDLDSLKLLGLNTIYMEFKMWEWLQPEGHRTFNGQTYCNSDHNNSNVGYHCQYGDTDTQGTWERCIINMIANNQDVIDSGRADLVRYRNTVGGALDEIDSLLEDMNKVPIERSDLVGDYQTEPLLTNQQYKEMDTIDKIGQFIINGCKSENIYIYDYNFWFVFFFLLVVAVSLFYASLKFAELTYNIILTQIIAPVMIASDGQNSGRSKMIIKNLISSYIVFILVAFLLKMYIISIGYVRDNVTNYAVSLIYVLMFGKGVSQAPTVISQSMGIDVGTGVRGLNGMSALMALNSVSRLATSAARASKSVIKAGGSAVRGASTVASGALGAAAGMVAPLIAKAPSNFKAASNSVGNTSFAQNHTVIGQALSGVAGVANAATGGIVPSMSAATNDFEKKHPNTTTRNAAVAGFAAPIGKGIANTAKGAMAGAKAGNALSHGQFRQAGSAISSAVSTASQIKASGQALNTSSSGAGANRTPITPHAPTAQGTTSESSLKAVNTDNKVVGKALTPPAQTSVLDQKRTTEKK